MDQHLTTVNWDEDVDMQWGSCTCGWTSDMFPSFTEAHEACIEHGAHMALDDAATERPSFEDWTQAMWFLATSVAQFALESPDTRFPPKIQVALDRLAKCDNPHTEQQ